MKLTKLAITSFAALLAMGLLATTGCEDSVEENREEAADDVEDAREDMRDGDMDAAREDMREANEDMQDAANQARENALENE
jgi:hypothetical protein